MKKEVVKKVKPPKAVQKVSKTLKEDDYETFLKNKVIIAEDFGFEIDQNKLTKKLFPHQKDIVEFSLRGGRRAIFANFGLGKTFIQLEIAKQCIKKENKPFLIVCPLAVAGEFKRDNKKLKTGYAITYITDTDTIQDYSPQIYITNYERVRMGDIDPSKFCGVSFDEASILRNLKTETTNYVMEYFTQVPYRFVATATPTPNDYIEMLNYACYLGVASRGHLLTRFFQRDPEKAGNLKLYPNKENEFWQWVSTWAVFVNKPSDLGYDDTGYDLPEINIVEHCVEIDYKESYIDKWGVQVFFKDLSKSLIEVSREKRESIVNRCDKAYELAKQCDSAIVWHHLEAERGYLEKLFKDDNSNSVYGGQKNELKEKLLIDFSEGEYPYLLTKPQIAGSGCNLQICHNAIFAGIDYKFNNFIQAIHREYRFGQKNICNVHIIYTENEYEVLKKLYLKWDNHKKLQRHMIELVREYGLNKQIIKKQMERQIFKEGKKITIGNARLYNNDTVVIARDQNEMPDNSVDFGLTSIPFGNHYEYSDNYNDFGHNESNFEFFKQMQFLTPHLYRTLKPGHVFAVHVKDRIRYSYQNGTQFTSIDDFMADTSDHFTKKEVARKIFIYRELIENGLPLEKELKELEKDYENHFHLIGKIVVTTDVVRENNQTYRLGWSEQCKDATKMGTGMPEYILLFRKPPTDKNNAYADEPVHKEKTDYTRATWQLDAHSYWRSDGNRFLTMDELRKYDLKVICNAWSKNNKDVIYSYQEHLKSCEYLEEFDKLSSLFMTLPPHSNNDMVWTDINRMNTLNAKQVNSKKEKHICPLQFDIIERLINRYTMKGDVVYDPFGGLFSTAYKALEMGRKAISVELNSDYFKDGLSYIHAMNHKINLPTLFDLETEVDLINKNEI